MGDPQASVTDFEMGWLVGVVDGEGHIGVSANQPTVKFVNTNLNLVAKLKDILQRLHIPYTEYDSFRTGNQRPAKRIEINSFPNVRLFLERICKYDFAKTEEAKALKRYCGLKMGKTQTGTLTKEEQELVAFVKSKSQRS